MTAATTVATAVRIAAMTAATGAMTAATAVPTPDCCVDSPRTRSAMNKHISLSASAGPATDPVNPHRESRPT